MSLPIPFRKNIPKVYQDDGTASMVALTNKVDANLTEWRTELATKGRYADVTMCPAGVLNEFAYMFGVVIVADDSEVQKRRKIAVSVKNLQYLGTWVGLAPLIQTVTGILPILWGSIQDDWWLHLGASSGPATNYWSVFGGAGVGNGLDPLCVGFIMVGTGFESVIPGNVYVDTGSSILTAGQVTQIVDSIKDQVPAYAQIRLGHTTAGTFIVYSGGVIN